MQTARETGFWYASEAEIEAAFNALEALGHDRRDGWRYIGTTQHGHGFRLNGDRAGYPAQRNGTRFVDIPEGDRALPTWTAERGWIGNAYTHNTLYAFTDNNTGRVFVRPADCGSGIGPNCSVRQATRKEAEDLWQKPLHEGWKVAA